jgi:uncharacterized iron-regulated membrane protein
LKTLLYRRKLGLKTHLYLGLFTGGVLAVIGLAGSLSVFAPEMDAFLHPMLYTTMANMENRQYRSLDEIVHAAELTVPSPGKLYVLIFPEHRNAPFSLTYSLPSKTPEQSEWHQIYVDPYTAEVLGQRLVFDTGNFWRGSITNMIVRFHYSLALDDIGKTIAGIAALFSVFSLLTGLIVWWPLTGKFRQALTCKPTASSVRRNFEFHKLVGFYFFPLLFIVLSSGVEMTFPEQVDGFLNKISPLTPPPSLFPSKPIENSNPIHLDDVVAATDRVFPDGEYRWIFLPQQTGDYFRVVKRDENEIKYSRPRRTLWLDSYTGQPVQYREPARNTTGDVILSWVFPLHTGEAFGITGRILVFLSGLACPILFVTGVIRWLQKRNAKTKKQRPQ